MSQTVIVTTREDLASVLSEVLNALQRAASFPPEILELEKLRRKEYLTEAEVEKLFGLKQATLRKRRTTRDGPAYSKDGERVLYSRQAVQQYLESRRQKTHDQP